MKKNLVLVVIVLLSLSLPAYAFFDSDVKKAKEFMEAGMFPQAINLLEKRINDKPNDAEAHYLLGVAYVNAGNLRGADDRFSSAVRMKPDYGFQIGGEYKKVGDSYLAKDDVRNAQTYFEKAIQYQAPLGSEIAKEVSTKAEGILNQGNLSPEQKQSGFELMELACSLDNQYQEQANTLLVANFKDEPRKTRDDVVKKYGFITSETKVTLTPPPVWRVVPGSEQTIIGKGMGKKDYLKIDLNKWKKIGCKIAIEADEFAYYYTNGFENHKGYAEFLIKHLADGKKNGVKLPKGEKGKIYILEEVYP